MVAFPKVIDFISMGAAYRHKNSRTRKRGTLVSQNVNKLKFRTLSLYCDVIILRCLCCRNTHYNATRKGSISRLSANAPASNEEGAGGTIVFDVIVSFQEVCSFAHSIQIWYSIYRKLQVRSDFQFSVRRFAAEKLPSTNVEIK